MQAATETLKKYFGFSTFRQGQEPVIKTLLQGRSTLAVFPTGGGKSLCYQLPALLLPGLTVVVSPLIALMKDQIDFLSNRGIPAGRLDSSLTLEEIQDLWRNLSSGSCKILYVSPERFSNEKFMNRLQQLPISMLVIDEAHCISEWGHNFRPDYMKLADVAKILKAERVLALTATATPAVVADIRLAFSIEQSDSIITGFHRPNLTLSLAACRAEDKKRLLLDFFRQQPKSSSIVYVTLQKTAENIAAFLTEQGFEAVPYHAGFNAQKRSDIQQKFMQSTDLIVVATIAFGMGIDKADIRTVFHYDPPKSLENYAQETGRAGRDGQAGNCLALICETDRTVLENFSYGDTPDGQNLNALLHDLFRRSEIWELSLYRLSGNYDIRPLVLSTLLCYLEMEGVISSTGAFYNSVKVAFIMPIEQVLTQFDSQRRSFLESLFGLGKKGRIWTAINLMEAAKELQCDRLKLTKTINYLEGKGMIRTQVSEVYQSYRVIKKDVDIDELSDTLLDRFKSSEIRDIARISSVFELVDNELCPAVALTSYFGETQVSSCGHCNHCLGQFGQPYKRQCTALTYDQKELISAVKGWQNDALQSPRQQARFLCGIKSPAASRQRPSIFGRSEFGALALVPFSLVLENCQ